MPSQQFLRTYSAIFHYPWCIATTPFLHKIYYILIPLREFSSRNFSLKLQMYLQQKKHVNCKKVKEMLILARVHSVELEIFAISFPLMSRHPKYNVQFLEALLPPFHIVCMSDQLCFPWERISLKEQRPSTCTLGFLTFLSSFQCFLNNFPSIFFVMSSSFLLLFPLFVLTTAES